MACGCRHSFVQAAAMGAVTVFMEQLHAPGTSLMAKISGGSLVIALIGAWAEPGVA